MSARVPVAAPSRWDAEELAEVQAVVAMVVAEGPYVGGSQVDAFEDELAASIGLAHAVGVASGTDALTLALLALDLEPGSDVLVPVNDGGYAALAATSAGHRAVVMDVAEGDDVPGAAEAQSARTPRTAAVVLTHLHGRVADVRAMRVWCDREGLRLVEDCAQAHGARRGDDGAGTVGDLAAYSFYPTKNLGALGDAGAVVTADPALADRVRVLRQYGWGERQRIEHPGGRNSRLDPLQAAVLRVRLPRLAAANAVRRSIASRYRSCLGADEGRLLVDAGAVAHHCVVVSPRRDDLARRLDDAGVDTAVHYPYLATAMPGLPTVTGMPTPRAERLRHEILTLPCFPTMTDDEVDRVCAVLRTWTRG